MSKASILRQLSDDDLEAIQHLIRRDAMPDEAIAKDAARRLGKSLHAKRSTLNAMVIARYRQGAEYKKWLAAWENRDVELRKAIETQKQRFEFVSGLVQGTKKTGLEAVSNGLMARLLTLAAEMPDDDLVEAAAGRKGWVGKVLAAVRDQAKLERQRDAEQVVEVNRNEKLSPEEREKRLKEIFGLA